MTIPAVVRKRFTTQEYEQIAAAGVFAENDRVELLEGEIVEMSPLGPLHSACVDRLNRLLQRQVKDAAIVRIQSPVRLGQHSEPQPDVSLLQPRADFYAGGHPEPEDVPLLVEVADSSLSYDRELKLPIYARAGIAEVWLVGLLPQTVEVFRAPSESGYGERREARRGESVAALNVPGVVLSVAEILG
jgi:Uma2 family endonuclease